jgi:hypothetical protein
VRDVVRRRLSVHCMTKAYLFGLSAGFPAVVIMSFVSVAAASDTKRVALPHSFDRDFTTWSDNAGAIRAELLRQSPWRLEISDHSVMFARFSDENSEITFVEVLTRFEMAPAAQCQNASQSSPAECQP